MLWDGVVAGGLAGVVPAGSDGDWHEAAGKRGAAEEIDDGTADAGGIDNEGCGATEFGAHDEAADMLDHSGVFEAEGKALQVEKRAAGADFVLICDEAPADGHGFMFEDGDGGEVSGLAQIEPDEVFGWRAGWKDMVGEFGHLVLRSLPVSGYRVGFAVKNEESGTCLKTREKETLGKRHSIFETSRG